MPSQEAVEKYLTHSDLPDKKYGYNVTGALHICVRYSQTHKSTTIITSPNFQRILCFLKAYERNLAAGLQTRTHLHSHPSPPWQPTHTHLARACVPWHFCASYWFHRRGQRLQQPRGGRNLVRHSHRVGRDRFGVCAPSCCADSGARRGGVNIWMVTSHICDHRSAQLLTSSTPLWLCSWCRWTTLACRLASLCWVSSTRRSTPAPRHGACSVAMVCV